MVGSWNGRRVVILNTFFSELSRRSDHGKSAKIQGCEGWISATWISPSMQTGAQDHGGRLDYRQQCEKNA
jgi:hypothetical protein